MPHNYWTREQDLAVLYLRHKGLRRSDPVLTELANAMNRTDASIWMRRVNFDSLDPSVQGVGLNHPAKLTRRIWLEYQQELEQILAEARQAFLNLLTEDAAGRPSSIPL